MNSLFEYSLIDLFRLIYSRVLTLIFFRPAYLIRQPTRIRGFSYIRLGKSFVTGYNCRLEVIKSSPHIRPLLYIGNDVQINDRCHIAVAQSIEIGNNVLIASNVFITDHDHGSFDESNLKVAPKERALVCKPVIIGDNVWIGQNCVILKGVTIGNNCVIAAGSVVTKSTPPNSLVAGLPAKVIKRI